jgi:YHS domain-containing protein
MGGEINPEVYIEYKGVKVYFCCWGCDDKFLAEPEKYIPKLPEAVQQRIRAAERRDALRAELGQTTCPVTGEPVDPSIWINFKGTPVHFAAPAAVGTFMSDSLSYIGKLPKVMRQRIGRAEAGETVGEDTPSPWQQTDCPVMGNPINPASYVDYRGVRVFFCCPGCDKQFLDEPEKYLDQLPAAIATHIREGGE